MPNGLGSRDLPLDRFRRSGMDKEWMVRKWGTALFIGTRRLKGAGEEMPWERPRHAAPMPFTGSRGSPIHADRTA